VLTGRKKDGSPYEAEVTISPVRDGSDRITNYVVVGRDVSERRRLERQLRQAQKMEAIGTLAGGIAHDFNNVIAAIIGFAEMALEDADRDKPLHRFLNQILRSGLRGRDLVRQILAFSRQTDSERKAVRVSTVAGEALALLRASLPATITIEQDIRDDAGQIMGDATEIEQVVINLVSNAAHAMRANGGVLRVEVSGFGLAAGAEAPHGAMKPGDYVRLSVSDTGHGMEKAVFDRIFDPFYTTKPAGEGTGLGLSVVHGIVRSHQGVITARSEPGRGSVFEIYLPRMDTPKAVETEAGAVPAGREAVLLVDDEEALTEIGKEMLERLGYAVTATTSSAEALDLFRDQPDRFDVVMTDQTMPHMTGIELARRMLSIRKIFR
jgi:signal transduction histidine kinase